MSQIRTNKHITRTQVVVAKLREKILSGELGAGEALRQSALADSLNVSRIPLREALVQLEAEGLVKFEAHKGASVAPLSAKQVTELFELRALIETDLLSKAIRNMTDAVIAQAESHLSDLENAFEDSQAISTWSKLNTQFHTCLYQAANRPHTLEMVKGLNTNCDRYIRLHLLLLGSIPRAAHDHRELLEYCRQRNAEKATALLKTHILDAADSIREMVTQQQVEI
ncbi:GntR family transcriptional regulator [Shewanella sp. AS1]|uniref:GntR family transcriptional regulator n=1 Tax=Shewanella sp. AS1 TaxID=2907626 RepID=UPI001F2DD1B8|nr:GntR family transcriptional regulator [Shewanella sp. AS1]MCE9679634.1 GntR family transcriptional regulator [Shewanella sp. AS1]